jgi:hypothetical protein
VTDFIKTHIEGDNYAYWRHDYSGSVQIALDDGRSVRYDVANGQITETTWMEAE